MTYSLHPATIDDAGALAEIMQPAFANEHIMRYISINVPGDLQYKHDVQLFRTWLSQGGVFGNRFTKAVDDDTGQAVGFAKWVYPVTLTPEQAKEKEMYEEQIKKYLYPRGTNEALADDFFNQLTAGREKWVDTEKMFFLHILAIHPDHQRRGLGTRLVEVGLQSADAAGAQAYVEASPEGYPLYLKHGWVDCDELVIDMRQHGGEAIERQKFLMREPGVPKTV